MEIVKKKDFVKDVFLMNYTKLANIVVRMLIVVGIAIGSLFAVTNISSNYEYKLAEMTTSEMAAVFDKFFSKSIGATEEIYQRGQEILKLDDTVVKQEEFTDLIADFSDEVIYESDYMECAFICAGGTVYMDKDGEVTAEDLDESEQWYQSAIKQEGEAVFVSPYQNGGDTSDMIWVVYASSEEDIVSGVCISTSKLQEMVKDTTKSDYGIPTIQDENGTTIISVLPDMVGNMFEDMGAQVTPIEDGRKDNFADFDANVSSMRKDGKQKYVFSKELENGWSVCYILQYDEFNQTLKRIYVTGMFLVLVLFGLNLASAIDAYRMEKKAIQDPLTGLINRLGLLDGIEMLLRRKRKNIKMILYMDLDDFKEINDTYGHEYGDAVLTETAKRMQSFSVKKCLFGRMGGDEFVGIFYGKESMDQMIDKCRELIACLTQPILFQDKQLEVGCSMGVAIYGIDGRKADELIQAADSHMYIAKKTGKNKLHYCGLKE